MKNTNSFPFFGHRTLGEVALTEALRLRLTDGGRLYPYEWRNLEALTKRELESNPGITTTQPRPAA